MVNIRRFIVVSAIATALVAPLFSLTSLSVGSQAEIHGLVRRHVSPGWFGLSIDEHNLRGAYCDNREKPAKPSPPLPRLALSGFVTIARWLYSYFTSPIKTANDAGSYVSQYFLKSYIYWTTAGLTPLQVAEAYRKDELAQFVGARTRSMYMDRACVVALENPDPQDVDWVTVIRACDCLLVYKPLPAYSSWRPGLWFESVLLDCTNLMRSLTAWLVASKWLVLFASTVSVSVGTFMYLSKRLWHFARGAVAGYTTRASYHHWTPSPEEVTHHAKSSRRVDCHFPVQQQANQAGHHTMAELRARLIATAVNVTGRLMLAIPMCEW